MQKPLPICPLNVLTILVCWLLVSDVLVAQTRGTCATAKANAMLKRRFPALHAQHEQLQKQVLKQARLYGGLQAQNSQADVVIPVAFHVVYNNSFTPPDRAMILAQLQRMNDAFAGIDPDFDTQTPDAFQPLKANTKISFCLGQYVDENDQLREAITYTKTPESVFLVEDSQQKVKHTHLGGHDALNPAEYLNVWITVLEEKFTAYSTFPGFVQEWEGVVINYKAFGVTGTGNTEERKTLIHEVGHYLFLRHPWGDEICGTDFVHDTPPASIPDTARVTPPKKFPFRKNSCGDNTMGEMYCNYMTYHADINRTMFTHGQASIMRATLSPGGTRETLLYSKACIEPYRLAQLCCPDVQKFRLTDKTQNSIAIAWAHDETAIGYHQFISQSSLSLLIHPHLAPLYKDCIRVRVQVTANAK